jgi:hypothetical protein
LVSFRTYFTGFDQVCTNVVSIASDGFAFGDKSLRATIAVESSNLGQVVRVPTDGLIGWNRMSRHFLS